MPACHAAKSQPLDAGLDWCSARNEQRVSRDHNIFGNTASARLMRDVCSTSTGCWGLFDAWAG